MRSAITAHPAWTGAARHFGINSASLSGELLFQVCDFIGIDVANVIAANNAKTKAAIMRGSNAFKNIGTGDTSSKASGGNASGVASGVASSLDKQAVRKIAREEIAFAMRPVYVDRVIAVQPDGTKRDMGDAPVHPQFHKLAAACAVRDFTGNRINVFLVGPTGTGKSYSVRQIAQLFNLPFYFQSQAIEAFDLVGYEKVNGVQKYTPFVTAFRDGGICLLDECDRYDAKASTALNSALANGEITLDNGEVIKRHHEFICIASGNTFGFGANADFTAAEKMDLSTISRFPVRIDWHIDADTETAIVKARASDVKSALAWLEECRAVRRVMERLGLPYLADQRCIEAGAGLLAAGMEPDAVRSLTYLASLDDSQKAAILEGAASALVRHN